MTKESRPNPYEPTSHVGDAPNERRRIPTARWLAVPVFAIGGAVLAAVAAFVLVQATVFGDFTQMIAVSFALIALLVGGVLGSIFGVGFARGTHLD